MRRYDNLFGDTAIMASLIRWSSLRRLSRENESLRNRIVHGSDYPFPPARLPFLRRTGLFPPERKKTLVLDLRIKRSFGSGSGHENRIADLLGKRKKSKASWPYVSTRSVTLCLAFLAGLPDGGLRLI